MLPLNISVLFWRAKMAPPCNAAKLLWKMLTPLKLNKLSDAQIAPPLSAELSVKLLVPLKVTTTLADVPIAPPIECFAEYIDEVVGPIEGKCNISYYRYCTTTK